MVFFSLSLGASTGCGKTFANAKVMRLLSEEGDSLRFVLALGLRTLTLQTGDEYREKIFTEGDGSDLAVQIGSQAVAELHASGSSDRNAREALANSEEQELLQTQGSESQQSLLDASNQIEYDGEIPEEGLVTVLKRQKDRQFLHAPVLVCTLDHMMPATETTRGGRYILPSLRLMSSDLVIDEIDDFTDADSIAIGRLIHLAGMLGRKVMISSATITPAMAEGYFEAYRTGWQLYAKTRSAKQTVDSVWIDEFRTQVKPNTELTAESARLCYRDQHNDFVEKRVKSLAAQAAKRKARILSCPLQREASEGDKKSTYFSTIAHAISSLHQQHHFTDPETGLNLSFGVVRMANINPCIALTRFLLDSVWAADTEIRIMPYHSQQVLLLRNAQEQHLDAVLKRKEKAGESPQALSNRQIRQHLAQVKQMPGKKQLIFILVATPVEEVGRDHDFDWAVIEPSSYRSIIQMAGRVRRHRSGAVASENIAIVQYNWKAFKESDKRDKNYFCRPGYESNDKFRVNGSWKKLRCQDHDLSRLLDTAAIAKCLDSVPRIRLPKQGNPLAQLEHAAINYQLNSPDEGPESLHGYLTHNWFLTGLPQKHNPFRQSEPRQQLYLALVDEEECFFVGKDDDGNFKRDDLQGNLCNWESGNNSIGRIELTASQQARLWLPRDYAVLVAAQAERTGLSLLWTSIRYGELSLREQQQNYIYNDQLGLFKDL